MASPYPAQAVPGQQYPPPSQPGGSSSSSGGGPAPIPDSYFTESRKGEISELRNLLRGFATERDPARKRDIIKKVIAYMTLGIDVSRLFSEMMLAIETRYVRERERAIYRIEQDPQARSLTIHHSYRLSHSFSHPETWSLKKWCTCI
jgi:hypothetical protein